MKTTKRVSPLRRHPLLLGILVGLAMPIHAQQQSAEPVQDPSAQATAAEEAPVELEKMVVTGSRIRRAGFDTLEPASVLDRTYIENRGHTNLADALNELPGFVASITPDGAQGDALVGVNFANRFGLGDNRTLTLINGRRFVSSNIPALFGASPGLQVDLNTIPVSMVERVENLSIGGAPTYGSDAIAGVVNVITRRDFEGVSAGMGYGVTERGDNQRFNAWSMVGVNFNEGRGNVTFSLDYDDVKGLVGMDREWIAANPGFEFNPANTGPNDGIPANVLVNDRRIGFITFGGLVNGGHPDFGGRFDSNGNLVAFNPGTPNGGVGGDGINFNEMTQVTSDIKRMTFNTTARLGITDSTDFFVEGMYYSGEARELVDETFYNFFGFSGRDYGIVLPTDYAMLTPQAADALGSMGISDFGLERANRDLINQASSSTTDVGRLVVGLEGDFEVGERIFYWESYFNYGRSSADVFKGEIDQQKFTNALHVVRDGSGNLVCSPTPVPGVLIPDNETTGVPGPYGWPVGVPVADPNCVPLDILGEGRASPAALDYITYMAHSRGVMEQQVFNANISSTLFDLWSGELQYNVGVEHRREEAEWRPDQFLVNGQGRGAALNPLSGSYSTNEFFGEFVMPLVNQEAGGMPGLRKLDITGKYRYVDNSINGSFNTYTYGLQWKPFADLEIRSNFTRSLRAPALMELYLPENAEFQFLGGDPCDVNNIDKAGPERLANCQAFLDYYNLDEFQSNGAQFSRPGVVRGNDQLLNESSDSFTYGFSWAPSFAKGLQLAVDYYDIEINDVIERLDASTAAQACFDNAEFNAADVPNANEFCSLVTRVNEPFLPDGSPNPMHAQFSTFESTYVNGAKRTLEAWSADLRYSFDTANLGRFMLGVDGYLPQHMTQQLVGGREIEFRGLIGNTDRYNVRTEWTRNNWGASVNARYVQGGRFTLESTNEDLSLLKLDDYWTLNAGASYRFNDKTSLRLAVSNLLDEEPPYPVAGYGVYDLLGRRYHMSFETKF